MRRMVYLYTIQLYIANCHTTSSGRSSSRCHCKIYDYIPKSSGRTPLKLHPSKAHTHRPRGRFLSSWHSRNRDVPFPDPVISTVSVQVRKQRGHCITSNKWTGSLGLPAILKKVWQIMTVSSCLISTWHKQHKTAWTAIFNTIVKPDAKLLSPINSNMAYFFAVRHPCRMSNVETTNMSNQLAVFLVKNLIISVIFLCPQDTVYLSRCKYMYILNVHLSLSFNYISPAWISEDFPSSATFWGDVVWGRYNLPRNPVIPNILSKYIQLYTYANLWSIFLFVWLRIFSFTANLLRHQVNPPQVMLNIFIGSPWASPWEHLFGSTGKTVHHGLPTPLAPGWTAWVGHKLSPRVVSCLSPNIIICK